MTCEHLLDLVDAEPQTGFGYGCPECVDEGRRDWVHLRFCMTCGHVGCCDSSPRRHASLHFQAVDHPVMRSYERGERWRWCFLDEELG